MSTIEHSSTPDESDRLERALAGDEAAFSTLAARYRPELQLHCYRMLGSPHDAEDVVQESLLRAWTKRSSFQGRSSFRAWLYGIATNGCLDALRRRARRILPPQLSGPSDPRQGRNPPRSDLPWLEPYPDRLLDEINWSDTHPESRLLEREATKLAFIAAIQHLPPRQRAVVILRDVLEWPARETAETLETTVASVNSALQRAHAALGPHLLTSDEVDASEIDEREQALLREMMDAWEHGDADLLASILSADARLVCRQLPSGMTAATRSRHCLPSAPSVRRTSPSG